MAYTAGTLVRARGREWVVMPDSSDDYLVLRPLGGTDQEIAGVYLPLEGREVSPARFGPPDPARLGDFASCRLLRDAVRLSFRSSAGPFRSFARINVEPRPYQLVPLLLALRLDPVRLLIADDVGIGKTIEAALVARELLDRGEVRRLAVLCPPHLAEQWQAELAAKFHIDAELVLASTAARLERDTAVGQSLFDVYPFTIVSMDYIKTARRRDDFVRACPELVIVDEAHTCAFGDGNRGGRQLRHQLLKTLAQDPARHMLLVTATPHSGDEGAFRSLLTLLRPDFSELPEDLSGRAQEKWRKEVAGHLVQRRRGDVLEYMGEDTVFPQRTEADETYTLSPDYHKLLTSVLAYARERVLDPSGGQHRQRVRWWSALALLRSLASSPAAAAATLRTRSVTADTDDESEAEEVGERSVLDLDEADGSEGFDMAPGALDGDGEGDVSATRARDRLLEMARRADALRGAQQDRKLVRGIEILRTLLDDGFNPIVFCRFIPTAEYLATELRGAFRNVEVQAVTGMLPPAERESRVKELAKHPRRILVATDCLSEGINLQEHFDAVVHYDLSWNPTRHEQREGRVDRYGQPARQVRAVTYWGTDNLIDGIVIRVLLRKHKTIRSSLGISVPLPGNSSDVVKTLMNSLMLVGDAPQAQLRFDFADDTERELSLKWDVVAERERRSRTLFAQHTIDVTEVAREWEAVRQAVGTSHDVERFVADAVRQHRGFAVSKNGTMTLKLPNNAALREACGGVEELVARFALPVLEGTSYLTRTHPFVEGLATYTMDSALDPLLDGPARRCGAIRTKQVSQVTVLLLLRFRFHIEIRGGRGKGAQSLLAESCQIAGYRGRPDSPAWLSQADAEALLAAQPDANVPPEQATQFLQRVISALPGLEGSLNDLARNLGADLLAAHRRVRSASRWAHAAYDVSPQLPPDVLGVFVLLPSHV